MRYVRHEFRLARDRAHPVVAVYTDINGGNAPFMRLEKVDRNSRDCWSLADVRHLRTAIETACTLMALTEHVDVVPEPE